MAMTLAPGQDTQVLYGNFRFHVQFVDRGTGPAAFAARGGLGDEVLGAFSEVSGIEGSMEHKVVRQGGVNYGARMLAGPVSFGTVILKRGIARSQTLWRWWSMFAGADMVDDGHPLPANRCDVLIGLIASEAVNPDDPDAAIRKIAVGWKLANAMPVKFRVGDLNAKGTDVAVEELHLVHEGVHMSGVAA
jgi:phage tail-like protein